jgi:transketolase
MSDKAAVSSLDELASRAKTIRRHVVDMVTRSKSSHVGTCFSIVDVLTVLYFRVMNVDPARPDAPERDRFLLSKAHGSAALYATLAERGFFSKALLDRYYVDGGSLPGHLDREAAPGVETSGGSLGHGLSMGIGMALAQQLDGLPGRVYVIVGDGECNEGSVWEAAMLAPNLKLGNLTVLVDYNKIQSLGRTDDIIDQRNLAQRWAAFGWEAMEVDGHNLGALEDALRRPVGDKPRALILHTVKGKGVSYMEDKLLWHYRSPNEAEYAQAMKELE